MDCRLIRHRLQLQVTCVSSEYADLLIPNSQQPQTSVKDSVDQFVVHQLASYRIHNQIFGTQTNEFRSYFGVNSKIHTFGIIGYAQLALALRLSSEATCVDDPNLLDPVQDDETVNSMSSEALSHRFWVCGC